MDDSDELISVLPIRFSNVLAPSVHIHQFPLLTRPLKTPPSAAASGKRIRARIKPGIRRLEVHVPVDTRPEVWNKERSKELGVAREVDDREKNQESGKAKQREGEEPRLGEVRMRSEEIPQKGLYMLGIVRNGQLHLHPISESYQLRPTLTYLDVLSRKSKRSRSGGSDSESDEGPPPDPDEPVPLPAVGQKKDKKPAGEAKEVQVSARKSDEKGATQPTQGGLSMIRREMLQIIRLEEDEDWEDLEFCDGETTESAELFESIFSRNPDRLQCKTQVTAFLRDISGL